MKRTAYYIESNTGCVSNKGRFDSWTCPKDGNIKIWNSKKVAERALKNNKEDMEWGLDNIIKRLEEETDSALIEVYKGGVEKSKKELEWVNSCVVKEIVIEG